MNLTLVQVAGISKTFRAGDIFEPLIQEDGALSSTIIASAVGIGAGRGIAMIFITSAFSPWISSAYAFINPRIRNLEEEIPDAIPDEPDEIEDIQRDDEILPVIQASSGQGTLIFANVCIYNLSTREPLRPHHILTISIDRQGF